MPDMVFTNIILMFLIIILGVANVVDFFYRRSIDPAKDYTSVTSLVFLERSVVSTRRPIYMIASDQSSQPLTIEYVDESSVKPAKKVTTV